jgi:predicted membrane protein DUF2142
MSRRSGVRLWLLAFAGFCLLHAGWAFAAPYNGPPDEARHAIRAAGVLDGQFVGPLAPPQTVDQPRGQVFAPVQANPQDSGGYQTVPESLVRPRCFPQRPDVAANCAAEPGGATSPVTTTTEAARSNPVYYLLTAWPLAPWPNWRGIMLSRLLNAAAMAALLACAVVAASRWTRHRALVAGIVVAATPMTAHLGGAINPNGIEIAAGVALFAALVALVHEQKEGINRAAVALAGASAAILVTPRFTGVLWLAVILGAILIPSSRSRLKILARARPVRIWSAVVGVAIIGALAWLIVGKPADPVTWDHGFTTTQILRATVVDHVWPNVVNQMVGVMGWTETLMPRLIYLVWFMAAGLLLLGGLIMGSRVDRWRVLALLVATFAPLLLLEIATANQVGLFNQGRYFLTGAVGLPMLGAYIVARHGLTDQQLRVITRFLAAILLPIHLVCLVFTMDRWDSGQRSLNPFNGSWHPPYGTALPLVLGTVAVAVLFLVYWSASRPADPPSATEPDPADTESETVPV